MRTAGVRRLCVEKGKEQKKKKKKKKKQKKKEKKTKKKKNTHLGNRGAPAGSTCDGFF